MTFALAHWPAILLAYLATSIAAGCIIGRMIRVADDAANAGAVMLTGNACDHDEPGSGR